ncbi:amidase domain-containing protein [Thermohalobacter berrensis]|uniref:Amidase domain-containing protein n=1 Tax=Thermohalobacter berrensis TaxID=99594 RepID=A0A419T5I9_9FIRM|nr:amidase domain-containing protein [Thermohalobacter berrensis]RKD32722.1 amidase domain-containing protein [Thermohalobacter berrensis]
MLIILRKRWIVTVFNLVLIILLSIILFGYMKEKHVSISSNEEITSLVKNLFTIRSNAMLKQNKEQLKSLYDTSTKYGIWAYEHELKRMRYLKLWAEKQGIKFINIKTTPIIRYTKDKENGIQINLIASTEYRYVYENEPDVVNVFRIGTYHLLDLVEKNEKYVITREWYKDPFGDSLKINEINSKKIKEYILSKGPRDFSNISDRRKGAVKYADKYCGAADNGENGYKYNEKYINYNSLGGDCANFASQILHEGGKFPKTYAWNYKRRGSKAWVNAHAFKNYILYSGRGSKIAYGTYNQVYKASYKLLPGDIVAYEKKGKVVHISVVTGADSKGYTLVNCHNTDRYRVPWDLGWSNKGIKFWLIRVHY